MRKIQCEECKKIYDFDKEDFCPRCGAFNQPVKTWGTDAQGNVIRVDGVNEQNHEGSFAHREVHREKRVRQIKGMDWTGSAKKPQPPRPAQQRPQPRTGKPAQQRPQPGKQPARQGPQPARKNDPLANNRVIFWIVVCILFFSVILPALLSLAA